MKPMYPGVHRQGEYIVCQEKNTKWIPQERMSGGIFWVPWNIPQEKACMRYIPTSDMRRCRNTGNTFWICIQVSLCLWFVTMLHLM
jgi:hypothetical protein